MWNKKIPTKTNQQKKMLVPASAWVKRMHWYQQGRRRHCVHRLCFHLCWYQQILSPLCTTAALGSDISLLPPYHAGWVSRGEVPTAQKNPSQLQLADMKTLCTERGSKRSKMSQVRLWQLSLPHTTVRGLGREYGMSVLSHQTDANDSQILNTRKNPSETKITTTRSWKAELN